MKRIASFSRLAFLIAGLLALPLHADDAKNLLPNATFSADQGQITDWTFSTWNLLSDPADKDKVTGTVAIDTDGTRTLTITTTDAIHALQMWWQNQTAACTGGSSYELTVSVKGTLKSGTSAHPTIGIYFLDATGKWIGFQNVSATQDATLPADWQKIQGKVTAPENAAKIGVRLGIVYTDAQADISYKEPVLLQK